MSDRITMALIAGGASILVAVIGTWSTIALQGGKVQKAQTQLTEVQEGYKQISTKTDDLKEQVANAVGEVKTLATENYPVGSVIASLLPPESFRMVVGDTNSLQSGVSGFLLMDNKSQTPDGLKYSPVPDLREMFLRGINKGRNDGNQDPAGDSTQGHFLSDNLQNHSHRLARILMSCI